MTLEVTLLRRHAELDALAPEWAALHAAARPGSPFEHPGWLLPWCRRVVADGDLRAFVVRRDGRLVALLPLRARTAGPSWLGAARPRWWQPCGTGEQVALTEAVALLALPGEARAVLPHIWREVERHAASWDWVQLSLGPGQGWWEPHWLADRDGLAVLHQRTRAAVVLPLPAEGRPRLKRNVTESLRRSRNRLARHDPAATLEVHEGPACGPALEHVVRLHAARAALVGRERHDDALADRRDAARVREAVAALAGDGLARVHLARAGDGTVLAGLLVLSDGRTDWLSLAGSDPAVWDLGVPTLLVGAAVDEAVRRGRAALNLSVGPDVAKTRWSEELLLWQDFLVLGARRGSLARYLLGSQLAGVRAVLAERRRHRQA